MLCGGFTSHRIHCVNTAEGCVGVEGATGDIWLFGIKETKVL